MTVPPLKTNGWEADTLAVVLPGDLENALRNLTERGTLVKDRGYRQVWRFEAGGRGYYVKFYPRQGHRDRWRRLFRGSPALREYDRLQRLQRAEIPAPRAVAYLAGLKVNEQPGDAVVLRAIEPSIQLDQHLNDLELRGEISPQHRDLSRQVRELVYELGKAGLGHEDLHLGNFLLHEGKVYLLDGYAVRPGGLRLNDVLRLGQSAARFGTRGDLLRGWRLLRRDDYPPAQNPVGERIYAAFMRRTTGGNRYFGRLAAGAWAGVFFRRAKYPRPWSRVSQMEISQAEWERAWGELFEQIERDRLEVLKRTRSGDVLAGEVTLNGQAVPIIVKRPRRKYWYRYLNEIGRGVRARRAWFKSWNLIVRNLPLAWPLIFMEKRRLGYVTDALIVFERIPGPTLAKIDLDAVPARAREMMFRRAGAVLRKIERFGFTHLDAKSSNWIIRPNERGGESPVLVDPDGIHRRHKIGAGIERLLRSMRNHPQYTPEDSLALCRGYAPWAKVEPAETEEESEELPAENEESSITKTGKGPGEESARPPI